MCLTYVFSTCGCCASKSHLTGLRWKQGPLCVYMLSFFCNVSHSFSSAQTLFCTSACSDTLIECDGHLNCSQPFCANFPVQSEIHTKETAANAALQAKRKAEYDLARERTMWQAEKYYPYINQGKGDTLAQKSHESPPPHLPTSDESQDLIKEMAGDMYLCVILDEGLVVKGGFTPQLIEHVPPKSRGNAAIIFKLFLSVRQISSFVCLNYVNKDMRARTHTCTHMHTHTCITGCAIKHERKPGAGGRLEGTRDGPAL
eukprot:391893-Pelagomonas_calceolata.AAC.5